MRSTWYRVVVAFCLPLVVSAALGEDGDPTFRLKAAETRLGSNIKRDAVLSGAVPLNKSYGEMTPEQRAIIHGWYENLGARDEPPFPRDGLAPIYRQIAKAQQRVLIDGSLDADVDVDALGVVTAVSIVRSTGRPDIDRYIASTLMEASYKPALCDGTPCRMSLPFRINFKTSF